MQEYIKENNGEKLKKLLWRIKNNSSGIHDLYRKLDMSITSVSVLLRENNWRLIITIGRDRLTVSTKSLSKRSLTELCIIKRKMIGEGSGRYINELLRDWLIFFLEEIGVEAHCFPALVKCFTEVMMHHLNLDDESLSKANLEYMTYVERKLRFK